MGSMIYIPVKGIVPITVNDKDYPLIAGFKWHAHKGPNTVYARCEARINGRRVSIYMHQLLMGRGVKEHIDHRDGNGLNNCRRNLRFATTSENLRNMGGRTKESGYKGVYRRPQKTDSARGGWQVKICVNRNKMFLGTFDTAEAAAVAYNKAALKYHGRFARLNEIRVR